MSEKLPPLSFDRTFDARHGESVELSPLLTRVTAPNPGPFTFHGTNSYVIGRPDGSVAVVDPGPHIPAHSDALIATVGSRCVSHIVVTHTHVDHSPLATPLGEHFNAPIVGCGEHRAARALSAGETNLLDASGDKSYQPNKVLQEGDQIEGDGWTLITHATPGHTINHLSFLLVEENALIAGDHVMAWSTTIVAPPDGSMRAYMASLEQTRALDAAVFWPGHGGPVREPRPFIDGLIAHRKGRESAVLEMLAKGPARISDMVPAIYADLDRQLYGAAGLSLFAHVEDLCERGALTCDASVKLDAVYRLAD